MPAVLIIVRSRVTEGVVAACSFLPLTCTLLCQYLTKSIFLDYLHNRDYTSPTINSLSLLTCPATTSISY